MNITPRYSITFGTGILLAGALFIAGCEVDSATSTVEITPDSVVLTDKGQAVTLTAVGGYECTWSLGTETWGTLNTRRGNQVIYTSQYQPSGETPVMQIVTVASRFTTMSSMDYDLVVAATNSLATGIVHYATAYITHLPTGTSTTMAVMSPTYR